MQKEIDTLKKLNLNLIEKKYRVKQKIPSGNCAWSFFGVDESTQKSIYIKFLLFPRSVIEKARFEHEIHILHNNTTTHNHSIPKLLFNGTSEGGNILFYITERVDGITLNDWIAKNLDTSDLTARLEIIHRISLALGGVLGLPQHRDLHPGNIIIQDGNINWHQRYIDNSFVKIVDWGQAYSPLLAQFDNSPDFAFILHNHINKEFTSSFYNVPPEFFRPFKIEGFLNYDSWAIGLLLYKLITKNNAFDYKGLGEYTTSINNNQITQKINYCKAIISKLNTKYAKILSELFHGLMQIDPSQRFHISAIPRVLWDIKIEDFTPENDQELKRYIANPFDYKNPNGWKYSSATDYD